MAVVVSKEAGGFMLRRMVPLTLGMVVATGWVRLIGETMGWFDRSFSLAAGIALSLGGFCMVLWIVARSLNRTDNERNENRIRLQLAQEASGLGIHDYDVTYGTIRWDKRVRELWGVGPEEPITIETFWDGVHPDDQGRPKPPWNTRSIRPAMAGTMPNFESFRGLTARPDGSRQWDA